VSSDIVCALLLSDHIDLAIMLYLLIEGFLQSPFHYTFKSIRDSHSNRINLELFNLGSRSSLDMTEHVHQRSLCALYALILTPDGSLKTTTSVKRMAALGRLSLRNHYPFQL
jgi:hypothetical protein